MTAAREFAFARRLWLLSWCFAFLFIGTTLQANPQESAIESLAKIDSQSSKNNAERTGYEKGFIIEGEELNNLDKPAYPFRLKFNGWGQLRHAILDSDGANPDSNQFQLARARIVLSGHAFTPDFSYFIQLDGRSSSGDNFRLLDYYLNFDSGLFPGRLDFLLKTGDIKLRIQWTCRCGRCTLERIQRQPLFIGRLEFLGESIGVKLCPLHVPFQLRIYGFHKHSGVHAFNLPRVKVHHTRLALEPVGAGVEITALPAPFRVLIGAPGG